MSVTPDEADSSAAVALERGAKGGGGAESAAPKSDAAEDETTSASAAVLAGDPHPTTKLEDEGRAAERAALQKRAKLGVFVLIGRTVILQFVVLGGTVYLARLLEPSDFGAFAIVQFALSFFALFGDAGLGAALVQSKEEPTHRQMSSVFWLQVLLASAVIVAVWLAAGVIVHVWPDLPKEATWLLRALSVTLLLTVIRVPSSIYLERNLQYGRLSVIDFFSHVSFWLAAIVLARMRFGVASLLGAVLIEGTVGLVLAYALRPFLPKLVLDREQLRPIVKFGLAYQMRTIVGFGNSAVTPIYAGSVLGRHRLGLNNWAQTTAYFPLQLVEIIGRVTFPLYSRMQNDRRHFADTLERSVQICGTVTLFFVGLMFGLAPNLIVVVYDPKWLPALPALYVYSAAISVGFLAPVVAAALDASGKPGIISRLSVYWMAANWTIVSLVMLKWRTLLAFAIAYCVHVLGGNIAVMVVVRRVIPEAHFWPRLRAAIAATFVLALVARFGFAPWATTVPTLIAAIALSLAVFVGTVVLIDRSLLRDALSSLPVKRDA